MLSSSEFLDFVRTRKDSEILLSEIDGVIESAYKVSPEAMEKFLKEGVRSDVAELFRKAKASEANFLGFLKSLRQILIDLKEVQLTLAFEPTEELIDDIYKWFKTNLNTSFVINFNYEPNLIGGAQIAYQGKFYEYSLRKELEQVLGDRNQNV